MSTGFQNPLVESGRAHWIWPSFQMVVVKLVLEPSLSMANEQYTLTAAFQLELPADLPIVPQVGRMEDGQAPTGQQIQAHDRTFPHNPTHSPARGSVG